MIQIRHYRKDPKLWELWYIPYIMGNAGQLTGFMVWGIRFRVLGFRV